jgi:hypothetical protein
MWMPRLEELVKSPSSGVKRISVAIHLGCPLIPGVNNDYRQCAVYNERAFELAMQGKFDHVLFISIWNYFPDGLNGLCVVEGGGCTKENARQIFLANYSKFAARIRRLADRGIKVTIILPPPVSAFNVPVELARRRFLSLEREQVEQLSREEQELRRQLEVAALRELEDVPGVKLIDPFDALCDQERCYLIDRTGRPILFDSNHWQPGFVRHNSLIDEGITG